MSQESGKMRLVYCTIFTLLYLVIRGQGQALSQLLVETPQCALPCFVQEVQAHSCSLTDLANLPNCVCTNIPLQAAVSACVQDACIFTDQTKGAVVLAGLCEGFPKESRQHEVVIASIAGIALTVVFVSLRCLSRFLVSRYLWWDDVLIVASAILLCGLSSIQIAGTYHGLGLHYWQVDPNDAETAFQLFYSAQTLYIAVQVTAKSAIVILFWRIFPTRWFRIAVWTCVSFLVGHGLIYLFLVLFQCNPVQFAWDKTLTGTCLDLKAITISGAAFSIFEDLVILALPIHEVSKLQLTFQKKVVVMLMFSVGSLWVPPGIFVAMAIDSIFSACITSMVRLKFIMQFRNTYDLTYDNVDFFMWSIIEVACAVICGCLPALRPLTKKVQQFTDSIRSRRRRVNESAGTEESLDKPPEPTHVSIGPSPRLEVRRHTITFFPPTRYSSESTDELQMVAMRQGGS